MLLEYVCFGESSICYLLSIAIGSCYGHTFHHDKTRKSSIMLDCMHVLVCHMYVMYAIRKIPVLMHRYRYAQCVPILQ